MWGVERLPHTVGEKGSFSLWIMSCIFFVLLLVVTKEVKEEFAVQDV